jgi:hypothetical protein
MALAIQIQNLRHTGSSEHQIRLVNPVMVAQEAIESLARSFRQMRNPSGRCTLKFPLDIILMIATHLDACSLVSFALTCKSLHSLWKPRNLPLQLAEKEKLLLLLEKDIPFLYYCHHCTKLHRWHRRWSRAIIPWNEESLPCKRSLDKHLWLPLTCHISYHHTRLVMNRHLYGSNHGLPLRVLNKQTRSSYHPNGVVTSVTQHARIFNDHLLVLSAISTTHSRGDSVSLRRHIDNLGHSLCRHVGLCRGLPERPHMQLPELAKRTGHGQFLASGPAFGSCTLCPTDYTITVQLQGPKKGFSIEVLVYRGLGDCRTPFSWHWRTNTWLYPREELRSVYSPDCRPGSIREQWDEAGNIA